MKRLFPILAFLALFLLARPAWGASPYYCDCTVNSGTGGAGTFADPFESINDINDAKSGFSTGDDVYFLAGSTCLDSERLLVTWDGTSGNRVIIGAYDGDGDFDITGSARPILDGNSHTVPGEEQEMIGMTSELLTGYLTIQDIHIKDSGYRGILAKYVDYVIIDNCYIEASYTGGIYLIKSHDSVVQNCITSDAGKEGKIQEGLSTTSILVSGLQTSDAAYDCIIRNNTVSGGGGEGISIYAKARDTLVEYNTVYDCKVPNIYLNAAQDCTIRYNLVYSSTSYYGPWGDRSYQGIAIIKEAWMCVSFPQVYDGKWESSGHKIYGNLIANCTIGIDFDRTTCGPTLFDTLIYNNTIVDCTTNISLDNTTTGWSGNEIKNNLSADYYGSSTEYSGDTTPTGTTIDYNLWDGDVEGDLDDNNNIEEQNPGLSTTSGWRILTAGGVDGSEFGLLVGSNAINQGTGLGIDYIHGLYVTGTDYTASPITVVTSSHADHGSNWEIGAFVYSEGEPEPSGEITITTTASDPGTYNSAVTTISNFTVTDDGGDGDDNRAIVVPVGWGDDTTRTITTIKIDPGGGDEQTFAAAGTKNQTDYTNAALYFLRGADIPAAGNYDIVATLSGAADRLFLGAIMLENVANEDPSDEVAYVTAGASGISSPEAVSTNITTATNNALVIDCIMSNKSSAHTVVSGGNQTTQISIELADRRTLSSTDPVATAGQISMDWTITGSDASYAQSILAWAPGAGLGAGNPTADDICILTISSGAISAVDCADSSTWTTGTYYIGVEVSEQLLGLGNPDHTVFNLSPDYGTMVGKYYGHLDYSGTWYLIYEVRVGYTWDIANSEWDDATGQRDLALQTGGTSIGDGGTGIDTTAGEGEATLEDGDGNSLTDDTLPDTDVASIVLANPKTANNPWIIGITGD